MLHGIIRPHAFATVLSIIVLGLLSCNNDSKSPTGPGDSTAYTITGRILENNVGRAGVIVSITGNDTGKSTVTGGDGSYTFTVLPGITYEITPSLAGYSFEPESRIVTLAEDTSLDDIVATKTGGGSGGDPHEIEGITFVTIPGGTFLMGDVEGGGYDWDKPVHTVTVSEFEMSIYELTNDQYAKYLTEGLASNEITATSSSVTGAMGEWSGMDYINLDGEYCQITYIDGTFTIDAGMENRPVVEISWYGAKSFAVHYGLDLPTEAEWEYACRGGLQHLHGSDDGTLDITKANYFGNVGNTADVGSYPANPFGLHEMSGNVWEWCQDWWGGYTTDSVTNPEGAQSGSYRVVRGGSWGSSANYCRSSGRYYGNPDYGYSYLGIRVVRRSSL